MPKNLQQFFIFMLMTFVGELNEICGSFPQTKTEEQRNAAFPTHYQ